MAIGSKVSVIPSFKNNPGVKKVGIYARVSTARVEQLRSLAAQVSALSQYTYQRNDMLIRDIYIDVGTAKTGSSRREFTRLLEDCKNRKINYVLVKNLSRFGRDTIESIESIRLLQNAGVAIYFMVEEKEITKDTPEFDLSVRASIIQSENEHRSENIKIGLRQKAELGTSGLYSKPCYGYVKDESGKISFLSIDTICLECYSTLEQEDKDIQRLNGEYHDYDTIQTAPIDISTPTPKAFEDECSSGGAHLWVGYKRSGLVICSKCDEHYSLYTVRKKKGLHLTSVEKAMIYWVLDSYLTATDKNGRYAYSQEEAFSLAERDCGVTRQFLEDNIWYGHAWNDYEQYYTR